MQCRGGDKVMTGDKRVGHISEMSRTNAIGECRGQEGYLVGYNDMILIKGVCYEG